MLSRRIARPCAPSEHQPGPPGCSRKPPAAEAAPGPALGAQLSPPHLRAHPQSRRRWSWASARLPLAREQRRRSAQTERKRGWVRAYHARTWRPEHARGRGATIVGTSGDFVIVVIGRPRGASEGMAKF